MVLGLACTGLFTAELFLTVVPGNPDVLLIPSALIVLWSVVGYTGLSIFPAVPPDTAEKIGWPARLRLRLVRLGCYLLASVFALLTIATLYTTVRLIGTWLRA